MERARRIHLKNMSWTGPEKHVLHGIEHFRRRLAAHAGSWPLLAQG